mgnify:CR=1 FL=1
MSEPTEPERALGGPRIPREGERGLFAILEKQGVTAQQLGVSFDPNRMRLDWALLGKTLLYGVDVAENFLNQKGVSVLKSLTGGDPVTLASLLPGQSVLDLGSGGGIDCFLAARKVGPTGHVIGVDMTPQMIDRARANKAVLGVDNVDFRLGEIEHLPVEENSVDVVISNCVINLSPDKEQVFREIFRVLKPGGKLAVSDIVTDGDLPKEIKQNLAAWAGCVAGAVDIQQYSAAIQRAGLVQIEVTPDYLPDQMIAEAVDQLPDELVQTLDQESLYRSVYSARITARKP